MYRCIYGHVSIYVDIDIDIDIDMYKEMYINTHRYKYRDRYICMYIYARVGICVVFKVPCSGKLALLVHMSE